MRKNYYLLIIGLFIALAYFLKVGPLSLAQSGGILNCPNTFYINLPTSGQIITGNSLVRLSVATNISVSSVTFYLNDAPIGPGVYNINNGSWSREWNSALFSNGPYSLKARVTYSSASVVNGTNQTCNTLPVAVSINNQITNQQNNLILAVRPEQWSGPTNIAVPIEVTAGWQNSSGTQDITTSSTYQWVTSIGSVQGSGPKINFSSGPTAGSGAITLRVSYSGKTVTKIIPITVSAYQAGSTGQTYTNSSPTTTNTTQSSAINKLKEGDSQLSSCLQQNLGLNVTQRLTYQQFIKTTGCFELRRNVIPANFAPIPPESIEKLSQKNTLTINKPINPVGSPDKLTITGKASPNQQVFIYIFSEPLVLSAKADGSGNWSYTLEDPLAQGEHKAYVAVEDSDGKQFRSNASIFGVEAVASSSTNPTGLSLALIANSPGSIYLYIGSSILLVMVAGFGIVLIHKFHLKRIQPIPSEKFGSSIQPTITNNTKIPSIPIQPTAPPQIPPSDINKNS